MSPAGDRCGQVQRRPPGQQILGAKVGPAQRAGARGGRCAPGAARKRRPGLAGLPVLLPPAVPLPLRALAELRCSGSARACLPLFLTDPGPAAPPRSPRRASPVTPSPASSAPKFPIILLLVVFRDPGFRMFAAGTTQVVCVRAPLRRKPLISTSLSKGGSGVGTLGYLRDTTWSCALLLAR